jgi:ubiquitin-like protein ATG12
MLCLLPAVVVRFKAVGNAPIMKQNFFRVTVSNRFQAVIQFLRKELGWKAGEPLVSMPSPPLSAWTFPDLIQFTYINLAFSPAPDDTIANLYRVSPSPTRLVVQGPTPRQSFATDGHLIVNYR